ncbi:MAG: phosphoglycerate kinase [Methanomassiliicoccales archaeon]
MKDINTLDDVSIRNKTVILRVDINLPLSRDTLEIEDDNRIRRILPTVQELLDKRAKVVMLAHQGRPGKWDFTSLEPHARAMSGLLGREVEYVDDLLDETAVEAITGMEPGTAILLRNVRTLTYETEERSMEEHGESGLVKRLAPLADLYVNDAFAAAHRSQCSLVGFPALLPSAAGRLMEAELEALEEAFEDPRRPCVFVLGGAKFSDSIEVIERSVEKGLADWIMLTGAVGNFFLLARGIDLGPRTKEMLQEEMTEENLAEAKRVLESCGNHIILPYDVAVKMNGNRANLLVGDLPVDDPILDIGKGTIDKFAKVLRNAMTIFLSGPAGMIEEKDFSLGTSELMRAAAQSRAFSLVGGGHTVSMVNRLRLADHFSYVSTGGGALETYLKGDPLPVVEALRAARGRKKK